MSRESESKSESASESESLHMFFRQAAPDAAQAAGAEADSEHDPRVARRTSLAGLRREAAAPLLGANRAGRGAGGAVSAAAKHEAQSDHASEASREAVEAALRLSAARIDSYSAEIAAVAANPPDLGPAGVEPILTRFLEMFASVGRELDRMNGEVSVLEGGDQRALHGAVLRFGGAVHSFRGVWPKAKKFAQGRGDTGRLEAKDGDAHLWRRMESLFGYVGLPKDQKVDYSQNQQVTVAAVQEDALRENVDAAQACAQAVQLGVAAGEGAATQGDLRRMSWHLREVASIVEQDPTGKLGRKHAARLGEVMQAARAARSAIPGGSALDELAKQLDLSLILNKLQPLTQRK